MVSPGPFISWLQQVPFLSSVPSGSVAFRLSIMTWRSTAGQSNDIIWGKKRKAWLKFCGTLDAKLPNAKPQINPNCQVPIAWWKAFWTWCSTCTTPCMQRFLVLLCDIRKQTKVNPRPTINTMYISRLTIKLHTFWGSDVEKFALSFARTVSHGYLFPSSISHWELLLLHTTDRWFSNHSTHWMRV